MTNTVHRGLRELEKSLSALAKSAEGRKNYQKADGFRRAARMVAAERSMLVEMDAKEGAGVPSESIIEEANELAEIAAGCVEEMKLKPWRN